MKSRLVSDDPGGQVHVLILDSGEEAFAALTRFANDAGITAASLSAIGAFEKATVGWFDFGSKTYKKIEVSEQCEVLSALGDVAVGDDGKASLHIHVVLGLSDGSTRGGHLLAGTVRPTLEVVLTEVPAKLEEKGGSRDRPDRYVSGGRLARHPERVLQLALGHPRSMCRILALA
jgi:predicted DNA-binding protein with PD1-like motif